MHRRHKLLIAGLSVLLFCGFDYAKGKDLYELKCAKCHKLRDPSDYSDDEWASWMVKMKKKAHLNGEQYERILKYLESIRRG